MAHSEQGAGLLEAWSGKEGDLRGAFDAYLKANAADPWLPRAHAGLSRCVLASGYVSGDKFDSDSARAAWQLAERGLTLLQTDFDCLHAKVSALLYLPDHAQARTLATYLVQYHGQRPEAHLILAESLMLAGDFKAAKAELKQAAKLAENSPVERRYYRAIVAFHLRQKANSWAWIEAEEGLKKFPDDGVLLHAFAVGQARMSGEKKAYPAAERALRATGHPETRSVLIDLRRILERDGKL